MGTIIGLVFLAGLLLAAGRVFPQSPASGPLRLHPGNPRYFADGAGKAVYLTGSHAWNNLPDIGTNDPPAAFDFDSYLRFLTPHHHNFIRLWRWEHTSPVFTQKPDGHCIKVWFDHVVVATSYIGSMVSAKASSNSGPR